MFTTVLPGDDTRYAYVGDEYLTDFYAACDLLQPKFQEASKDCVADVGATRSEDPDLISCVMCNYCTF